MNGLAALLLGALFLRPRAGVLGTDHRGPGGNRGRGRTHRQMQHYQGSSHTHTTVDPSNPAYQVDENGTVHRVPLSQQAPTYDPTQMDPGYAQQYYGGVAYPGQDFYGGGVPVAYGGYSPYGGTYGGGYGGDGGDFGSDLDQYQADLQAWMDQ